MILIRSVFRQKRFFTRVNGNPAGSLFSRGKNPGGLVEIPKDFTTRRFTTSHKNYVLRRIITDIGMDRTRRRSQGLRTKKNAVRAIADRIIRLGYRFERMTQQQLLFDFFFFLFSPVVYTAN